MPEQSARRGRGCLFYGCLTLVLVIIALFVGTYFGIRQAFKMALAQYTDTAPVSVPSLNISETERTRRIDQLQTRLENASARSNSIALNETDLNLLLGRAPGMSNYNDQIFLHIETNALKAKISLPLDQFKLWQQTARRFGSEGFTGRYLNATITLDPSIQNQNLHLHVRDIEVRGNPLPSAFTSKVRLENIAEQANTNREVRAALAKIHSIAVTNGAVQLDFKSPSL